MNKPSHRALFRIALLLVAIALCVLGKLGPLDVLVLAFVIPCLVDAGLWLAAALLRLCGKRVSLRSLAFAPRLSAAMAAAVIVKTLWMLCVLPAGKGWSERTMAEDLTQRRDYLVHRVLASDFGPESSPFFLPPEFKEEWAIGTISMTGLALAQLAVADRSLVREHRTIIESLIERLLKDDIRLYEQRYWGEDALDSLEGSNGHIGYLGHLNLLLGLYRRLDGDLRFDSLHQKISSALSRRILSGSHPYLETFPKQIFVPDNAVVIASLALADRVQGSRNYAAAEQAWLSYTRTRLLDSETGLMVPWVSPSGEPFGRPRGSYATWNVAYLFQADPELALDQAQRIRHHFLQALPFGACAIRECLPGVSCAGDIDSGPVLFGLSTSGSGFGFATAKVLNDAPMTDCLSVTAEAAGFTPPSPFARRYLTAPLIGDAIILAMRTTVTL